MARKDFFGQCIAGVLAAILVFLLRTEAAPVVTETGAMAYLMHYGYLNNSSSISEGLMSVEKLEDAIKEFQGFAGINVTGVLNEETSQLMATPRCGVKDKIGASSDGRSKRYTLQGSRWRIRSLTYRIKKYPSSIRDKYKIDKEIARAFAVWSEYTDLTFIPRKSGPVHIEITFAEGEHGDGDPFDGPGGTLAHAFFPVYGGDAHFDNTETWTIDSYHGTNLFQVAAHEFGHSLGLSHSDVKSALMAPFYRGFNPNFVLDNDDIYGIQALYGQKTTYRKTHTTTASPPAEEDLELCSNPKVDTIFMNADQSHIYAFKGEHYWRLTDSGVESGYPKRIRDSWEGLPGNIDAAFTYRNGKTYFFKGSKYWRYVGKKMDGDYPKDISDGFTGIPDNIDAAVVWTGNGKIYFYKGNKFWQFDPTRRPPVKNSYPKPISNWEGVPDNIDAAIAYKGYTYFFKDNGYYRFNDGQFAVDQDSDIPFPRGIAGWWFGCKSASRGTLGNVQWQGEIPEDFAIHGNLDSIDGDQYDDDNYRHNDAGDMILDAGGTDEQLVTSPNQDTAYSAANGIFETTGPWNVFLSIGTLIVARYVVAT